MQENEIHPWKCFAPKNSTKLILGTFPPAKRNWSFDFFYPNKSNFFWKIMSKVAKMDLNHIAGLEAVEERKELLESLHIAITDMGFEIVRNDGSSLDENLSIIQYMDIFKILDENIQINKILLMSSSGPVSAAKWFLEYLKSRNIIHSFPKGPKPLKSEFHYQGRKIELVILYSPSQRAANRISFEKLVEMYENEMK